MLRLCALVSPPPNQTIESSAAAIVAGWGQQRQHVPNDSDITLQRGGRLVGEERSHNVMRHDMRDFVVLEGVVCIIFIEPNHPVGCWELDEVGPRMFIGDLLELACVSKH